MRSLKKTGAGYVMISSLRRIAVEDAL